MADTGLTFKLFGVDVSASKVFEKVGHKSGETGEKVSKFGKASGLAMGVFGAVAGAALGEFGKASIEAASDLGETQSKVGVIFGKSSDQVNDWSQNAATAFGASQQQALDAAATFGVFGKSAGLQGPALSGFSEQLVGLSGDLASFYNTSPDEAMDAIGAALRGEAEPIRKYGVLLDDATLRNQALKMGLISTTKTALTPQQKVLAAHAVILNQTKVAQGDFARTSGGLANQQRIMSAEFKNAQVQLGQLLLPAMLAVTKATVTAIQWASQHKNVVAAVAAAIGALVVVVLAVKGAMAAWNAVSVIARGVSMAWTAAQWLLNAALTANPIGLVVLAIVALIAIFVLAYNKVGWFRAGVQAAMGGIVAAFHWMQSAWGVVWRFIQSGIAWIRGAFPALYAVLSSPFTRAASAIKSGWNAVIGMFRAAPGAISSIASGMWTGLWTGFRSIINMIISGWNRLHFGMPSIDLGPLGSVGGFDIGVPQIPYLAKGGLVTKPTLAMIGEAGPEAVIPLSQAGQLGGGNHYHFTFSGPFTGNAQDFVRAVQKAMRQIDAQGLA